MKMTSIKVRNMSSSSGNLVPNQFEIWIDQAVYFQSYDSVIAFIENGEVYLDATFWDYSRTTLKYLTKFLRERTGSAINSSKDIRWKIAQEEYKLTNLNQV